MSRVLKLATVVATVAALATIFAPALWRVSHGQALTNVLVGEFATLAMGYTAYRIAYGRDASRSVALAAAVFGAVLAISPRLRPRSRVHLGHHDRRGLVAIVSLVAFVTTFTGDDRSVRGVSRGQDASEDQPEAV